MCLLQGKRADSSMQSEPFGKNFSLIPTEIVFKYRKVSSYYLLYIENMGGSKDINIFMS